MDIVFPQYYEWHTEMDKLCRVADFDFPPEVLHEIFNEVDEAIKAYMKWGYSEEIPNPEKKAAESFWGFAFSPVLATRQSGTLAYFRTLENSSDLATSKVGGRLLAMLFLKFFAERFIVAIERMEKTKKRKSSKRAKK